MLIDLKNKKKQKGASLVEYVLLVMLITIVAIVAVRSFGTKVSQTFSTVNSGIRTT